MENIILKNLLVAKNAIDHSEMLNSMILATGLFIAAILLFVCGMFAYKKLFFTLSFASLVGYFYVSLSHLDIEFLWLIVTMMGVVMFVLEALVPGIQFFALLGVVFLTIGISNSMGSISISIFVIALALLGSIIIIYSFSKKGYRIKAFDRFILHENIDGDANRDAKEDLIGKRGHTLSALRPTGKGNIDGNTYDLYSEVGYIPENTEVVVVKKEAMKIIVRRYE